MHISNDIRYIGVNDHQIDLFEGQYIVPNGMAYNSYVIMDEKIAVLDTVDQHFGADWFANLEKELDGRQPDYLVVHHMEPDHSANIGSFAAKYPNAKIVASLPAFNMMKNYYETDFPAQKMVVKEGSTLELGKHTLTFIGAAMVHWPEVLMSYESTEKVLFTADAFGKFGALDVEEDWACEARRYYIGIVGSAHRCRRSSRRRRPWIFRRSVPFTDRSLRKIWDTISTCTISGPATLWRAKV